MIAVDILEWPGMNQAFLVSLFGTIALALVVIPVGMRRPTSKPTTWGEAIVASTYVFGVMLLAFGVVPHQWIAHADADLGWTRTKTLYGPGEILKAQAEGGWFPFTLQYEAVRDTIVVIIHVLFFAMMLIIWSWWQKRDQLKPSTELATSSYGRPLMKKS